jgi:hypothetical protein
LEERKDKCDSFSAELRLFQDKFNSEQWTADKVYVMDETGAWSNMVKKRGYAPR